MPKGSLYAAHRAAGAASGRYKASLYDVANVGYAMEADVGIEQYKQKRTQETFATIGEALSLAETIRGSFASKKKHEELMGDTDIQKPEKSQTKVPTLEEEPVAKEAMGVGWNEPKKVTKSYAAGAPGTGEIKKPIKQEVHIPTVAEAEKALAGKPGRELKKLQEQLAKMDLPVFD
jgi:hypothetical protein